MLQVEAGLEPEKYRTLSKVRDGRLQEILSRFNRTLGTFLTSKGTRKKPVYRADLPADEARYLVSAMARAGVDTTELEGSILLAYDEAQTTAGLDYEAPETGETYFDPEKPNKPEGVPTELADVIIRILDFCEWAGIDLQAIMEQKHAYNLTRAYRHGNKRT